MWKRLAGTRRVRIHWFREEKSAGSAAPQDFFSKKEKRLGQRTGDRGQGTGDRGQGTGDRGQRTEDRKRKCEHRTFNIELRTSNFEPKRKRSVGGGEGEPRGGAQALHPIINLQSSIFNTMRWSVQFKFRNRNHEWNESHETREVGMSHRSHQSAHLV